ncbi:hypothetical protein EJV47_21605 [Hymenobacter gummosus]|uniref:Glycosyltransferase subfamily 4-like N-terminal domain-containing protein n=1 Tax=Hymenobacter gummosus TaxID=1776032 RepID=A0A3S0JE79_9BACT|nr:glycosyltransferase family 4 protein [Hymenobacter gummosus]RTQ46550.1 hypothetical protein EJV47_21605 [Hymenobacter gummosus]
MPMPAAPSSVLLLGWDDTSTALPFALALPPTTAAELWTAQPLPAAATAGLRHKSLDVTPPLPVLPQLGHRVPAFPYVGRGVGQPQSAPAAAGTPVAVPAAPYLGSSAAPPAYPARPAAGARARTSAPAPAPGQPVAVPPAPYAGATHAETPPLSPLQAAPVPDYRIPVAALPSPPADAPFVAEPGPAEAAELATEQPLPPVAVERPAVPADLAPAALAPAPAGPAELPAPDASGLDAEDEELLRAGAANNAADLNFRIIQYARHAARLAFESPFELIFAPDWHTWLAGVELRQLTRRPLVLQVTQLATDLAPSAERGWVEALERITLPQADRILVPDEATAARLRQRYRLPAERLYVLPAAPDLSAALVLDSRFYA